MALAIVGGVSYRLCARTGDPELLTNKKGSILVEPFFVISKHRANQIFHKFTFLTWLQQILILGDSSQLRDVSTLWPASVQVAYPFLIPKEKALTDIHL